MKKLIFALSFCLLPATAFAEMDNRTYRTERDALAKTVALEEECQLEIDIDAMMAFVPQHFEGYESKLLSDLDAMVTMAKLSVKNASELQKKLLCATAEKYIIKHKLNPAN